MLFYGDFHKRSAKTQPENASRKRIEKTHHENASRKCTENSNGLAISIAKVHFDFGKICTKLVGLKNREKFANLVRILHIV